MVFWSVVTFAIVLFIFLVIIGIRKSKKDKKFIEEMMRRTGWQRVENPKEDVKEWVSAKLNSQPDLYTIFGQVREWHLLSSVHRDEMLISDMWTKQEGDKTFFVLDVTDWYHTPSTRGSGKSYRHLTIIGRQAPGSLPFFTLFPKMEFPKTMGWRYSISEAHGLNLSNKINELAADHQYVDYRVRQPLELPDILEDEKPAPPAIDPPITFDARPFNDRFELYGKETERVRQFFDNQKLTEFESLPQTFVDAGGELIFVYIPEYKPGAEDFEKVISDRIDIINAVSRIPKTLE